MLALLIQIFDPKYPAGAVPSRVRNLSLHHILCSALYIVQCASYIVQLSLLSMNLASSVVQCFVSGFVKLQFAECSLELVVRRGKYRADIAGGWEDFTVGRAYFTVAGKIS